MTRQKPVKQKRTRFPVSSRRPTTDQSPLRPRQRSQICGALRLEWSRSRVKGSDPSTLRAAREPAEYPSTWAPPLKAPNNPSTWALPANSPNTPTWALPANSPNTRQPGRRRELAECSVHLGTDANSGNTPTWADARSRNTPARWRRRERASAVATQAVDALMRGRCDTTVPTTEGPATSKLRAAVQTCRSTPVGVPRRPTIDELLALDRFGAQQLARFMPPCSDAARG